jgi:hypothetical protein
MGAASSSSAPPWPATARRVAFVGAPAWLEICAPDAPAHGLEPARFPLDDAQDIARPLDALRAFAPAATVVFDPCALGADALGALAGPAAHGLTLGVLVDGLPPDAELIPGGALDRVGKLDRLVTFDPGLTGERLGERAIWRAIPPPVSDALFGDVHPLHRAPRAMTVGRSTEHRETMLMPTKHDHDLLQVLHGVGGAELIELLREYDVGVYVPREPGRGFGHQAAMHLAAGHLLLAAAFQPTHGLERDIDYLQVESPDGLVWVLDRMDRFPEMYQRIRVRGRLKSELFRASRLFARIVHDLTADVAAFGRELLPPIER